MTEIYFPEKLEDDELELKFSSLEICDNGVPCYHFNIYLKSEE